MVKQIRLEGFEDYSITDNGVVMNKWGKIVKPQMGKSGCLNISLCNNKKVKHISVAQLVMMTFRPDLYVKGKQIVHKDGNNANNNINNLSVENINKRKRGHRTSPITVYNMLNNETMNFCSISDFARYLVKVDVSKNMAQHLRTLNHYLLYKPRFFIYNNYRVNISSIELNDEEKLFNINNYISRDDICKRYDISNYQFDRIIKKFNVKTYNQRSIVLYKKDEIEHIIKDEIAIVRGKIYYKYEYDLDYKPIINKRDYIYVRKGIKLHNLINDEEYCFKSMSAASRYLCGVIKGSAPEYILQVLSKQLSSGKNYYKFFEITEYNS